MSRVVAVASVLAIASPVAAETHGVPDTGIDPTDPSAEVIGGTAVPPGKWPDTVAVLGQQGSCTGTLIAPDVVLTAGHCAEGMTNVIANTTNYNAAGGIQSTIKTITAYPNWENSYDVAVIVLDTPIAGVTPRKIGTSCTFQSFAQKPMVHLVGFGSTDPQGNGNNTLLNEVMTPVTDPECTGGNGCQAAISPGGEFVAGGQNKDSCFGDSGGPVYLDTPGGPVVIGAVSRGLDNSATPCGGGGIYVRTDKIVQWIEMTAGKPVSKDDCQVTPPPPDDEDSDPDGDGDGGGGGNGEGGGNGDGGNEAQDVIGGCAASGGAGAGMILLGLALPLLRRRRRDQKAQD